MEHKYVRFGEYGFILWPKTELISHRQIAAQVEYRGVISAGFVTFKNGIPSCYGESFSLGISSLPEDSEELKKQLGY